MIKHIVLRKNVLENGGASRFAFEQHLCPFGSKSVDAFFAGCIKIRSTIHKESSLIGRYCLAVAAILTLLSPLEQGDLYNDGGVHNLLYGSL